MAVVENQEILGDREIKTETNTESTEIHSVDTDKSNGLAQQLAIGGLIGAVMGTVAVVLADRKTASTLNRTAKDLGNAVKGATEGVNSTIKNGVKTVKNKASGFHNTIDKDSKSADENETDKNQIEDFPISMENSAEPVEEIIGDTKSSDVQVFQLYEERLIANKKQVKTGEVAIAKHTETYMAQISVPLEKERLVMEQIPIDNNNPVAPDEAKFNQGELFRVELYEQTAEIEKKAFVREQIRVCKEVEYKTLEIENEIRREELDLNIQDRNNNDNLPVIAEVQDSQQVTANQTDLTLNSLEEKL